MGIARSKSKSKSKSKSNKIIYEARINDNFRSQPVHKISQQANQTTGTKYQIYKPEIAKEIKNTISKSKDLKNLKDINIELLVFGYAHINEKTLSPPLNIVPLSIIQIFMKYYCIEGDLLIFLAVSQKVQINGYYTRAKENKFKYIDFINNRTVTLTYLNDKFDAYSDQNSSIFAQNIPIPRYLYSKQTKIKGKDDEKTDDEKTDKDTFFFDSQVTQSKYSAIIRNGKDIIYINNKDITSLSQSESEILSGYKTTIPQASSQAGGKNACYLYSANNGLICFSLRKIQQLKFDTNTSVFHNWDWKYLTETKSHHSNGSLCWIRGYSFTANDSISNEKIFICGGNPYGYNNTYGQCELYDIKNNTLTALQDMPNARSNSGCFFDKLNKNVYVGGGGSGSKYNVDCYDFNTNSWYSLPDTSFPHSNNPMLYMNGYILYIVGNGNAIGSIEMYDTRDSIGRWCFAREIQIDSMISKDPCTIYKIISNKSN